MSNVVHKNATFGVSLHRNSKRLMLNKNNLIEELFLFALVRFFFKRLSMFVCSK